ncbi:MAG: MSMEG_0570 family nitrogen starvation response protein [Phyllobacterium sp.]|jgi:uncharacterized repeat protein (TIGR04042 family)|uniref:MSMEG_0570 family nitrogen starvation response protein n=1 Tax=Phyllobacterium sp. TaxID=1871046 RepID=UPI0030F1C955
MPEMRFVIVWPDGEEETCYSPSLIVKEYLAEGQNYPLSDFLQRSGEALSIASDRVEAKHGFPCSLARNQLAYLEARGNTYSNLPDAIVRCQHFIF